ncbi:DUF4314 domain-containing protein [Ruminococcus sp. zg-924]|uniref:DUF4314 domain-containing protein n=1 Tax=Ruminococcus sp. zg-924 TaxID=2678505 RepID=UPI00210EEA8F|nr:DUF4314 domain-containing protein [Ruminococcus sp. zg-924]MCQ4022868.1 DUF4314 domain-containing protein [Ruminococcus sp. zg-924]
MNEYERLRRQAEGLREIYPKGTRVECLSMMDPFAPVPSGTRGTVFHVDDMATIHVNWDNGSTLGLVRGEDSFRKLSVEEIEAENNATENEDEFSDEEGCMRMKM